MCSAVWIGRADRAGTPRKREMGQWWSRMQGVETVETGLNLWMELGELTYGVAGERELVVSFAHVLRRSDVSRGNRWRWGDDRFTDCDW